MENKRRKWSKDMDDELRMMARNHTVEEIAEKTGRSMKSITARLTDLKVSAVRANGWPEELDRYLIEHHGTMTLKEMGEALNKDKSTVAKRCLALGLRKQKQTRPTQKKITKDEGYVRFKR